MTLSAAAAYAFAFFVVALIPGPGITALVARALGAGFAESFAMATGIMLGDLVFLTAVVLGLSVLAQTFAAVFLVVKYAGVAYLLWLAYRIWTAGILRANVQASTPGSIGHSFLSGLIVTLGNPKAMLFYVALVPTLIDLAAISLIDYLSLVGITILVLVTVTVPYILLAARTRALLDDPVSLRRLNRISAGFLASAAIFIAIRAN